MSSRSHLPPQALRDMLARTGEATRAVHEEARRLAEAHRDFVSKNPFAELAARARRRSETQRDADEDREGDYR